MERLAILAGGGSLPLVLAASIERRGDRPHLVAVRGEADKRIEAYSHTWVGLGSVSAMLSALKRESDGVMMIAGAVSRPDLLRLKPDFGIIRYLPQVLALMQGGDDAVLTRVVRFFEAQGLRVKGVGDVAPELLAAEGTLGADVAASDEQRRQSDADTALGFAVLDALSYLDVGQAIAVDDGRVLAIEGAEGTDRMLARIATLRADSPPSAGSPATGVVVKGPKRGQELRVDLPTVGAQTIGRLVEARIGTLVVTAGNTLLLEREEMIARAAAGGVVIRCIRRDLGQPQIPAAAPSEKSSARRWQGPVLGRISPSPADSRDALTAAEVTCRLARFDSGRAAVVVRDHVLAIAAAEGPVAMAERVASLRQWGRGRFSRTVGAAAIRFDPAHDDPRQPEQMIEMLAGASLAGVAIVRPHSASRSAPAGEISPAVIAAADRHRLFLIDIATADMPATIAAV